MRDVTFVGSRDLGIELIFVADPFRGEEYADSTSGLLPHAMVPGQKNGEGAFPLAESYITFGGARLLELSEQLPFLQQYVSRPARDEFGKTLSGWSVWREHGRWVIGLVDRPASAMTAPATLVDHDTLSPSWPEIHAAYPTATDAFSSPSGDLLVVVLPHFYVVLAPQARQFEATDFGPPLLWIPRRERERPIQIRWATGAAIGRWHATLQSVTTPLR
jgi:hypothetical protein